MARDMTHGDRKSAAAAASPGRGGTLNASVLLVLRQNPLFAGLRIELIERIAAMAVMREFDSGEYLFREGEQGKELFGIISGLVRISATSEDGRELNLNMIGPGEIIGEIAFLDGGPRTASGQASESTLTFLIAKDPFHELMLHAPDLPIHLLKLVCERTRWTSAQVTSSAFLTVQARLVRCLLQLPRAMHDEAGDARAATVRISQSELGRFLGISRQVVNGYLQDWQRRELVQVRRGRIVIHDIDRLVGQAMLSD
ncbi:MAG: Crp/Fnr family transcriptional regulator [Pseudomonadota bacterium]